MICLKAKSRYWSMFSAALITSINNRKKTSFNWPNSAPEQTPSVGGCGAERTVIWTFCSETLAGPWCCRLEVKACNHCCKSSPVFLYHNLLSLLYCIFLIKAYKYKLLHQKKKLFDGVAEIGKTEAHSFKKQTEETPSISPCGPKCVPGWNFTNTFWYSLIK